MMMSRDARKVVDNLSKLVGRVFAASDVLVAEGLCFTYFPNNINSIVKQIYKKSSSADRADMQYYVQPVRSMAKQKRTEDIWDISADEAIIYLDVTRRYLIEDFNYDQLVQLRAICAHSRDDVTQAISIGKSEEVYSIPYILRILEGMEVRRQQKLQQIDKKREMVATGDGGNVVHRGALDMAGLSYEWLQTIENVELERRVKDLYGEGK